MNIKDSPIFFDENGEQIREGDKLEIVRTDGEERYTGYLKFGAFHSPTTSEFGTGQGLFLGYFIELVPAKDLGNDELVWALKPDCNKIGETYKIYKLKKG